MQRIVYTMAKSYHEEQEREQHDTSPSGIKQGNKLSNGPRF